MAPTPILPRRIPILRGSRHKIKQGLQLNVVWKPRLGVMEGLRDQIGRQLRTLTEKDSTVVIFNFHLRKNLPDGA